MSHDSWLRLGVLSALIVVAPVAPARGQDAAGSPGVAEVSARSIAAWADPGLPVTGGLVLWLDAERLDAARVAHGLPALPDGSWVDVWHDASGHGRHLAQPREEAQPTIVDGALRFDGEASYLERRGNALRLADFTLFLVAAPLSNSGGFRGFLAINREGEHDYTSGLNVDQGFGFSWRFEALNVEGKGFGGMANLLTEPAEFGLVRRLTVTSTPGAGGTRLHVDGRANGARDRAASTLDVDRITVGARRHGAPLETRGFLAPLETRGFLDGDIVQVLRYDRALADEERRAVEAYLADRLGGDREVARRAKAVGGLQGEGLADPRSRPRRPRRRGDRRRRRLAGAAARGRHARRGGRRVGPRLLWARDDELRRSVPDRRLGPGALPPGGRARHDPEGLPRLPRTRDPRHRDSLPGRLGVQPPRRPVRDRPGGHGTWLPFAGIPAHRVWLRRPQPGRDPGGHARRTAVH